MHRADKAVLRLAVGMGLSVLIAYGLALPMPFVVCVLTTLLLCKPGPPLPFAKGVVVAGVVGTLLLGGVLMVPLLEHYRLAGVVVTALALYAVYFKGALAASPLTTILVIAFTAIPVAGVLEQALVTELSVAFAVGLGIGVLVGGISHGLFPDAPEPSRTATASAPVTREAARWAALQATLVVMPVFVIALTNPALYIPTIMKTAALGQQAGAVKAASAGRELVGSTIISAAMALAIWVGLSMWPTLWMLILWMTAAALWAGRRLFRAKPAASPPSFWVNALMTMLILLGPAIEDAAVGKDVLTASATRVALFIAAALYAWAAVWALERWRTLMVRRAATVPKVQ
jgi:hypothetical protein